MGECTCDVKPPERSPGYGNSMGKYAIYMAQVEDATVFDPACPFHGDDGSMVARISYGRSEKEKQ